VKLGPVVAVGSIAGVIALLVGACSPASIAAPSADAGRDAALDAIVEATVDAPTDAATSYLSACKQYAYTRCTAVQTCSPTSTLLTYGTVQVCEQYYEQSCVLKFGLLSIGASVAKLEACTSEIASWKCSDLIYAENPPPDCQTAPGLLANGTACAINDQCQSTWCLHPYGSACGACAPAPAAGTPCVNSGQGCGAGLECIGATGECATRVALGSQCSSTQPCDDALACVAGVCTAEASPIGASCNPDGAGCDIYAGLTCNASTNTCATILLVNGGHPCGQVGAQTQECITGSCVRGACVQGSALGAACDPTSAVPCVSYAQCIVTSDGAASGTCLLPGQGCP
jgi:hypothetical protein